MGVNIKLFVEIDYSNGRPSFANSGNVRSLSYGEFFIRRNYPLFYALAGLSEISQGVEGNIQLTPRGLPAESSNIVYYRYYHIVDERVYPDIDYDQVSSSWCVLPLVSEETAQQWVHSGLSHYAPDRPHALGRRRRRRVSNPNWRYANWLTVDEFLSVIRSLGDLTLSNNPEVLAISSLLTRLREQLGPDYVRLIYWFDNELPPR